jgi:transcriptional regulator with XRE-family HTH domain
MARRGHDVSGLRVAQARQARGLTQDDLAGITGIHRVTITKIENGQAKVSLEALEKLASALERSREWLLGEPENVDEHELARERIGNAMHQLGEALEDIIDVLYGGVTDAKQKTEKVA